LKERRSSSRDRLTSEQLGLKTQEIIGSLKREVMGSLENKLFESERETRPLKVEPTNLETDRERI